MYQIIKQIGMPKRLYQKIWLIMRLTTVLLIACLMQVSASGLAQMISLNERNAPLSAVLKEIRKQSGYDLLSEAKAFPKDKKVTVVVTNVTVEEALNATLKGLDLTYEIDGKTIAIKQKKEASFLDNLIARFPTIDVKGRIVDSLGNALPGANVSVKNGKTSISSGANGDFLLKNIDEDAILIVSYLGFTAKEVVVKKDFMYVQLHQSLSKLDEVQVIAYGKTSQRLNTGNVTTITSAEIERQPVNNLLYALQGRVSGLEIAPTTGLSGGAINVQIRGRNSLTFNSVPLFVVDGIPIVNNIVGLEHPGYINFGETGNQLSSFSFINPNDIETISVLKDADATSIYGSRGANGVILVTTKKGKAGEIRTSLDFKQGWSDVATKMNLLGTADYLSLRNEALANSGINPNAFPYTLDIFKRIATADVTVWDQSRYTNWQKELIGNTALTSDFQGSIGGGFSSIKFGISGNYHKENSVFGNDNSDQRGSMRMNISGASTNQRLKASLSGIYMYDKNTLPGIDFTQLALTLPPNAPSLYTAEGQLNWELLPSGARTWDNPYAQLTRNYNATVKNLIISGEIAYQLIKNLEIKTQFGYNDLAGSSFRRTEPLEALPPDERNSDSRAAANFANTFSQNLSVEPQLCYHLDLPIGKIDALIAGSYQSNTQQSQSTNAFGAVSDALLKSLSSFNAFTINNSSSQYKYAALFSRLSYNYKNTYLANFSLRRDGSSRFGPGKQFGTFGSGALAWVLSEENFFKNIKPLISFAKARISYGTSGNDGIGDYAYFERYTAYTVNDPYQGQTGYLSSGLYNPYYSWEVTKKGELGLELGFFNDRLLINSSYYINKSNNQLQGLPIASIAGPGGLIINIPAEIQNSGFEFSVKTDNIKASNFQWSSYVNFSSNRNKLLSYPNIETSPYFGAIIGKEFYGVNNRYNYKGVNSQTGLYEFTEQSGTVVTDPRDAADLNNGRYIRTNVLPKFYGGLGNTISYKSISLDFLLQFTKQIADNPSLLFNAGKMSNIPEEYLNRWQRPGDNSLYGKLFANITPDEYTKSFQAFDSSTFRDVDASFLRIKNVALNYEFSRSLVKKFGLNSLKCYLLGQNLVTWTKYKGLDPETRSLALPPLRTWVFGLKVTL